MIVFWGGCQTIPHEKIQDSYGFLVRGDVPQLPTNPPTGLVASAARRLLESGGRLLLRPAFGFQVLLGLFLDPSR